MNEEAVTSDRRVRKPRPEVQLYRPGMLRKGDSTKSLAANEEKPPRPDKLKTSSDAPSSSRRRSNDTDSVTSRGGSGSTTPDANVMNERNRNRFGNGYQQHDRRDGGSSYNSTQSLYDNRRNGGYTEYGGNRSNRGGGRYQNQNRQSFDRPNYNRGFNERASMRGDGAITKRHQGGGRRRNDSINSTQSEMPTSTKDQLHIDTTYDSVSQCGASSTFSMNSLGEAFSFEEMCQNLQSFASLDWSKEVEKEAEEGFLLEKQKEEEEERSRLQEANGQSRRRGRNRRNLRNDESDRESSFGGSIAEEIEEDDELKSGEKTPTSTKSSVPAYNPRMLYQRIQKANNENNGYSRRPNYQQETTKPIKKFEKKGGYRGEHDDRDDDTSQYDAVEQHMSSGRLAGRISIVQRDHEEKNRSRQQAQADELTKAIQKRSNTSEMPPREVLNRRRKEEIERNEGVQIKNLGQKIEKLAVSIKKRDLKAAEKAIRISLDLAKIYSDIIFPDIVYSFTAGLEQKLFRQAFYKSIEALRSGANSAANDSKLIRSATQKLLLDGIVFYEQLIRRYETTFEIDLDAALIWPNGFPSDTELVENPVKIPFGVQKFETASQKTALKSLSRHLISLGDLHRYKCLMDGSENYETSKNYYLKSAQLWPSSGHPYNQLGVVVFYSMLYRSSRRARLVPIDVLSRQRQKRVIDEFSYLTRALGCSHPYEAARDRLTQRLDAMRNKVAKYQPVIDKECGIVKEQGSALRKLQVVRQLWINPINEKVENGTGVKIVDDIFAHFLEQPKTKLHRRAVSYLCDTFGMLVTKIGMDHFGSVSERALGLLYASLSSRETDFSAEQLVKLSVMFVHSVQANFARGADGQLQIALDTTITFYSVLVDVFLIDRSSLLLPAINVIATWICHEETLKILEQVGRRITTLPSTILTNLDVFHTMRKVLEVEFEPEQPEQQTYPEHVLLASFYNLFDGKTSCGTLENGRIGQMVRSAEILKDRVVEPEKDKEQDETVENEEEGEEQVTPRTRQQMIENEREKGAVVIVIHPQALIPDTNVLIGDLELVKDLLKYNNFQFLLPTIVIEELSRLSLLTPSTTDSTSHDPERTNKAKLAMGWLKEQAKLKTNNLYTLTTTGKRLASLLIAQEELDEDAKLTNDDRILKSALNWTKTVPTPSPSSLLQTVAATSIEGDVNAVFRTAVLLTGDRGLTIKAVGAHLPCRDISNFYQWIAK